MARLTKKRSTFLDNVICLDERRIRTKLAMVEESHQRWLEGRNPSPMQEAMDDWKEKQLKTEQDRKEKNSRVLTAYRIK